MLQKPSMSTFNKKRNDISIFYSSQCFIEALTAANLASEQFQP